MGYLRPTKPTQKDTISYRDSLVQIEADPVPPTVTVAAFRDQIFLFESVDVVDQEALADVVVFVDPQVVVSHPTTAVVARVVGYDEVDADGADPVGDLVVASVVGVARSVGVSGTDQILRYWSRSHPV